MKNGEKKTVFYPFFSIIMPFRIFYLRFLTHGLVKLAPLPISIGICPVLHRWHLFVGADR